jgi:hypothetical protein
LILSWGGGELEHRSATTLRVEHVGELPGSS